MHWLFFSPSKTATTTVPRNQPEVCTATFGRTPSAPLAVDTELTPGGGSSPSCSTGESGGWAPEQGRDVESKVEHKNIHKAHATAHKQKSLTF